MPAGQAVVQTFSAEDSTIGLEKGHVGPEKGHSHIFEQKSSLECLLTILR